MTENLRQQVDHLQRQLVQQRREQQDVAERLENRVQELDRVNAQLTATNQVLDEYIQERTRELLKAYADVEASSRALQVSNQRFEMAMRASGAAVWDWNVGHDEFYFSDNLLDMMDYPDPVLREAFRRLTIVHPQDRLRVSGAVRRHVVLRRPLDIECRLRLSNGVYRWFRVVCESEWQEGRRLPSRSVGSVTDIEERLRNEAVIERLAIHDSLTDIPNRSTFGESLDQMIVDAQEQGESFAVLIIDLNDFKSVNDSLGHAAGDRILKEVATILQQSIKGFDVAARLGADEFGVILKKISQQKDVEGVCETILASLYESRSPQMEGVRIAASIGIARYPLDGRNAGDLLVNADLAMQQAKQRRHRKGDYVCFTSHLQNPPRDRLRLEQQLEDALEAKQFCVDYQAEVVLEDQRIFAAEALLRWQHPERGRLPPTEFIEAAERSGLIIGIGEWVVDRVCGDLSDWLDVDPDVHMAVNLSPVQLSQGNIVQTIEQAMQRHGCPPWRLEVEVTENVLMQDLEHAKKVLNELHEIGVLVSLDDFGSGYSSLAYLQQLPIDKLKIDRIFVSRMMVDDNSRVITETIIRLAHALKIQVLAEGVEDVRQVQMLKELGCDFAQGFLIACPRPFAEFIDTFAVSPEHDLPIAVARPLRQV